MPVNKLTITEVAYAQSNSITIKRELDVSPPLLDSDGTVVDADVRNPINKITLAGEGDIDAALVTGASLTTTLLTGGKTLIESVEDGEKNEGGYQSWTVSAIHAPGA